MAKKVSTINNDLGKYVGEVSGGVPNGRGKFYWNNGDEYDGEWVNDVQEGYGVHKTADGVYEGEWKNGVAHGKGKMVFKSGVVYEGEWFEDKMEGNGVLKRKNGAIYTGQMKNDKPHGRGKETYTNGDTYEGDYFEGKKHGKGFYKWPTGMTYEGDYVNDAKEGHGIFRWPNGESYEGEVRNGQKHGKGIHRYTDGSYYAGNFIDGKEDHTQPVHRPAPVTQAPPTPIPTVSPDLKPVAEVPYETASDLEEELDFEGWRKGSCLGKGSFGQVYLGLLKTGKFFAVKTVEFGTNSQSQALADFQAEIDLMKELRHRNIVRYFGSEFNQTDNALYIFLEYVPLGTLSQVCKKFGSIALLTVRRITRQILEGLAYLHQNKIVHRDIKGDNILLDKDGNVKLADFGCSKKLDELCSKTHGCNTMVGTPYWMAPEVITNDGGYGYKADIWSVGCTVCEMLTGQPPWPEFGSMWTAIYHIANSTGPPSGLPSELVESNPDLKDFLDKCFQRNVALRPTALELLQHPFITKDNQPELPNLSTSSSASTSKTTTTAPSAANATTKKKKESEEEVIPFVSDGAASVKTGASKTAAGKKGAASPRSPRGTVSSPAKTAKSTGMSTVNVSSTIKTSASSTVSKASSTAKPKPAAPKPKGK